MDAALVGTGGSDSSWSGVAHNGGDLGSLASSSFLTTASVPDAERPPLSPTTDASSGHGRRFGARRSSSVGALEAGRPPASPPPPPRRLPRGAVWTKATWGRAGPTPAGPAPPPPAPPRAAGGPAPPPLLPPPPPPAARTDGDDRPAAATDALAAAVTALDTDDEWEGFEADPAPPLPVSRHPLLPPDGEAGGASRRRFSWRTAPRTSTASASSADGPASAAARVAHPLPPPSPSRRVSSGISVRRPPLPPRTPSSSRSSAAGGGPSAAGSPAAAPAAGAGVLAPPPPPAAKPRRHMFWGGPNASASTVRTLSSSASALSMASTSDGEVGEEVEPPPLSRGGWLLRTVGVTHAEPRGKRPAGLTPLW